VALALYRKYRPRTFAEVIGQEHVTEPLSQALRSGRLHHAYLFSGPRGCGKTSSARILARSLNCEQGPTPEPCGVCASCRSLANDGTGSIDVIEIDAASHGGVDDARDLREKAFFAPASSRYKIYVIDEAHMVSSAGFNALLKLVEEPPDYVKFIFATTEPEKVLGTIKSRTHHYPFRLIPPAVLRPYLQQLTEAEGVHVEPAVFPLVVRAGAGSARDTLSVLDQLIAGAGPDGVTYARAVSLLGVTDVALLDEMIDALAAGDGATAYATIDRVAEAGHDARRFASDLLERFRDLIIMQQVPDAVAKGLIDGPADQLDAMGAQATRLGPATLSRCADIVHNGLVEMRGTTAPRLLLELITARMLLPGADDSTGALLQRLERMERRLTLSGDSTDDSVRPQQPAAAGRSAVADAPGGSPGSGGSVAGGSGGGGGISAARAAAAAAGRRTAGDGVQSGGAGATINGEQGSPGSVAPSAPASTTSAAASTTSAAASPAPMAGASSGQPGGHAPRSDATSTGGQGLAGSASDGSASEGVAQQSGATARTDAGLAADAEWAGDEPDDPGSSDDGWDDEPGVMVGGVAPSQDAVDQSATGRRPAAQTAPGQATSGQATSDRAAAARAASGQAAAGHGDSSGPAGTASAEGGHVASGRPAPPTRRAEPAGVLPDAPEEPGLATSAASSAPGQLSAAAIREVWPEIIADVGRKSKKLAALASGATVRDLDGQTVVLTFRFPAHAKMVAADPDPIVDALYEALGGRWQIRCEVSGEAGGVQSAPGNAPARSAPAQKAPAQKAPAQKAPARPAASAPARQREVVTPAASTGGEDDWPEPARPGGLAPAPAGDPQVGPSGGDAASTGASGAGPVGAATSAASSWDDDSGAGDHPADSRDNAGTAPPSNGVGTHAAAPAQASASGEPTGASAAPPAGWPVAQTAAGQAPAGQAPAGQAPAGQAPVTHSTSAQPATGSAGSVAGRSSARNSSNAGLAAARAAAAGARGGTASARPGAAAHPPAARADTAPTAADRSDAWSDGSPAEEPPYDPDYDGPVRGGAAAYEGFDPGDEPLDEVIDEKTARQSSEQQAMQLLQEAFGAEKIGEV
jgi:DNA polymerase-3 subunit gamma/tau